MRVKKYNLYNITSLYVIQVSDSQGIFIDYNMLFSISTLVSSIDLQLKTIIICCDYVSTWLRLTRDKLKIKTDSQITNVVDTTVKCLL